MTLTAYYYDGISSHRHDVTLMFSDDGRIHLRGQSLVQDYAVQSIVKSSRLGKTVRLIDFADGARLEVPANGELDQFMDRFQVGKVEGLIHRLEHSLKYIAIAVLVTALTAWGFLVYGIPAISERIAYALPVDIQNDLGEGVLEALDGYVFTESQVDKGRQASIQAWFDKLKTGQPHAERLQLQFRNSELMGANAMALPSGTIVVTDGLVALSQNDEEIAAVLAHEIGHVEHRHSLRAAIQNSGVAVVIALMLGDVSSISSFATALPTLMVNMKYSRNFETEADNFARTLMQEQGIPLHYFADILTRLGESHHAEDAETSFFDSHPAVKERILQFQQ